MELVYDYIGIGFGPSNLALAIATQEHAQFYGLSPNVCFLERKPGFNWHEGMLIDGSTMQISFLKDLVTQRNPGSHFSFINYLKERGRLQDFINLKTFFPTREEYNDYLGWAASHFAGQIHFGEQVIGVEPCFEDGRFVAVDVLSRSADGGTSRRRARNLVFGIGGVPQVPGAFEGIDDPRVLHSSAYRGGIEQLLAEHSGPLNVAVIGAGQSAAEIFEDLANRFDNVNASLVIRGSALKPSDDSPFVNQIFNPSFTDTIFQQTQERRESMLQEFRNTNYSVVDPELIEAIFQRIYQQKVRGEQRHQLLTQREVVHAEVGDDIELFLRNTADDHQDSQRFDVVILATGYRRDYHHQILAGIREYLQGPEVDRNYRLSLRHGTDVGVYLQGCCEESHGLSDTLLSVLAIRSREVAESIFADSVESCASRPSSTRERTAVPLKLAR
ncbi:lysine N(6)-hydroxylase/L-ornithine N(5)-oxygenase family protein [Pseudomonas schmalbachii]|uniref:Lysine N(6)-hydroxylase/L-ornithine N(5)-oxygenase family protein n=1 Tax=Pseudomonas schmalbachii TaxID=2816993 RepID=A0ABS3TPE9_9PSED|nr:lysine N(6)-hydroxylase/L-ornithine N(5)-oxygenase family protein [Pseudomonas schmalbachii]MBO3275547.1 lysine N(6)-hydroxylase/L-ornithine N(5)-oxygenase family protein [Pseudomonas schmalbachii]